MIFDLVALPKNADFHFNKEMKIQNDKKSKEIIDLKVIELRSCSIAIISRATNYTLAHLDSSVVFQQELGKSLIIKRVKQGRIVCQVSNVQAGAFSK